HECALESRPSQSDRHGLGPDRACARGRTVLRHDRRRLRQGVRSTATVLRPRGRAAAIVSVLDFLSPDLATPDVVAGQRAWRSPLERALSRAPADVTDVSLTGKLEVRGAIDDLEPEGFELFQLTPDRALVFCDFTRTAQIREQLSAGFFVIDVSAVLAGLQVHGETLLRRLTDLDLEDLPAVGAV